MCIAYPGHVVQVDPRGATVESDGRLRRASTLLLPDIAVGDWVTVSAGTIVDRLTPAEAADVIDTLRAVDRPEPPAVDAPTMEPTAVPSHRADGPGRT